MSVLGFEEYKQAVDGKSVNGLPIIGPSPERSNIPASLDTYPAPVAPGSYRSASCEGNYATRASPLPEQGAGVFDGISNQITFSHTYAVCKPHQYEFKHGGQDLFKGTNTTMGWQSNLCDGWGLFNHGLECIGFLEPFQRHWDIKTVSGQDAFSLDIKPGWLDSQVHSVKGPDGAEIGRILQPSYVQRISDMWRATMQVVVRIMDSTGHERFTLRRHGGCGPVRFPFFHKFFPRASDLCYGRWNLNLAQWVDCDFSFFDCGTCQDKCGCTEQQPCLKLLSCRQCCEYRECEICFSNPGTHCCDCDCWQCDKIGVDKIKCYRVPLCVPKTCLPGDGCGPCTANQGCGECYCGPYGCKDCDCCYKLPCDVCAVACKCNCCRGVDFACCKWNWKCCKFTNCGANWVSCIKLQCCECWRCIKECPDCGLKCKTCISKIKPQCCLEWNKIKRCAGLIPTCIKNCIVKCPHRCKQCLCGGRDVHIELDVYGPDGDGDVPVCKIVYDGVSGWCFAYQATLRPQYTCTVNIPATSPYYRHYHKKDRACDFVDLALLTGLALWYDYHSVAPREWFQCTDGNFLDGQEKDPGYLLRKIDPPLTGATEAEMVWMWLFGPDLMFLLSDNGMRHLKYFLRAQELPAGTMPEKWVAPNAELAQ